jgi:hypothetical protein
MPNKLLDVPDDDDDDDNKDEDDEEEGNNDEVEQSERVDVIVRPK